ncbi:MAG: phosphate regulon sensor histidine kinase PhoR [Gammaproteobacteria bacterium]
MDSAYWGIERWRLALVFFVALVGGLLTSSWLASLTLALAGYVFWLMYKLNQLNKWLESGVRPSYLPDNNGIWARITQQIQGMQKKSEKRKRRVLKMLKRVQGITSNLPYATVVLHRNNEIDWANKASEKYLGIDIKRDRDQRIDNLIRLPEFHKLVNSNEQAEIEIPMPQDQSRQLAVQLIPAQKNMRLLIARDISERIQIQQMRKNFIANASHELRTPLTVIAGYLEILQSADDLPDHLQTAVQGATIQSDRMLNIIEDLLILSRLENSGFNEQSTTVIDVASIVQSICDEEVAMDINAHDIKIDIDSRLQIKGIESEIISICSNLIHNAFLHTSVGTRITIEWKKKKFNEACLVVSDTGKGIAIEHIAHLTERFYRVDQGRSQDEGGTGLGLAIVQHVVKRHGAKLTIHSTVGKGSSFVVCFPGERVVVIDSD